MKLHTATKNKKHPQVKDRNFPSYTVYTFFLFHMLLFGGMGFFTTYFDKDPSLFGLYLHGGIAIVIYTRFYLVIFGRDKVIWMFINAGLGLFGTYDQIGWLLSKFGKEVSDYPAYLHVIPFLYFVLYTFLMRNLVLDIFQAREDETKKRRVQFAYVAIFMVFNLVSSYLER